MKKVCFESRLKKKIYDWTWETLNLQLSHLDYKQQQQA